THTHTHTQTHARAHAQKRKMLSLVKSVLVITHSQTRSQIRASKLDSKPRAYSRGGSPQTQTTSHQRRADTHPPKHTTTPTHAHTHTAKTHPPTHPHTHTHTHPHTHTHTRAHAHPHTQSTIAFLSLQAPYDALLVVSADGFCCAVLVPSESKSISFSLQTDSILTSLF